MLNQCHRAFGFRIILGIVAEARLKLLKLNIASHLACGHTCSPRLLTRVRSRSRAMRFSSTHVRAWTGVSATLAWMERGVLAHTSDRGFDGRGTVSRATGSHPALAPRDTSLYPIAIPLCSSSRLPGEPISWIYSLTDSTGEAGVAAVSGGVTAFAVTWASAGGSVAGVAGFSGSVTSRIERWNSLMVLPMDDPISGSRFGPNISSATATRIINSGQCSPGICNSPFLAVRLLT